MIRNIIFDIGNVLADFRPRGVLEELGVDPLEAECILKETIYSPLWHELDRGVIPEETLIARMKEAVPEEYYPNFDRFFTEGKGRLVRTFPYAIGWLKEYRERGLGVYLLSNYPVSFFEGHSRFFSFLPFADGRVISGYVQMAKPDPEIFRYLMDQYELRAEECVFVDDREDNIETAAMLGIHAVRFLSYEDAHRKISEIIEKEGQQSKQL